mgnify:CR=1 FL=1
MFAKNRDLDVIKVSSFVEFDGEPVGLYECEMKGFSELIAAAAYKEYTVCFGLVTPNKKIEENKQVLGYFISQIQTVFTRMPGLPNLSEMFLPSDNFHWVPDIGTGQDD